MKRYTKYLLGLSASVVVACQSQNEFSASGTLDLSNFYAIGDDFSAGFANGGLYRQAQQGAFPNLIAQQAQQAGIKTNAFAQPLFSTDQENGSGYYQWTGTDTQGLPKLSKVNTRLAIRSNSPLLFTKFLGHNSNLSVPNLCVDELNKTDLATTNGNPYFERIAPNSQKTFLQVIAQQKASFFSLWLGNNDLLMNALNGGTMAMTNPKDFEKNYRELLKTLTTSQAKGIVFTIPDFMSQSPYFTKLKASALGGALKSNLYYKNAQGTLKKASDNDLILLSADSIGVSNKSGLPKGYVPSYPLSNQEVLDTEELSKVRANLLAYNQIIMAEAKALNLVVIDSDAILKKISIGQTENGQRIDAGYPSGGFYSLDGYHFTPRGNAFVANEVIKILNTKFRTQLSLLNLNDFLSVQKL